MKKPFFSITLVIVLALLLLTAAASRGSEWRSTLQPACAVEDDCRPKECGIRTCGTIDLGCGLGSVSCGECSENQYCDDGLCLRAGADRQCPCGGYWPSACEDCPDQATPPQNANIPTAAANMRIVVRPTTTRLSRELGWPHMVL